MPDLLRSWKVDDSLPPGFEQEVWERIAARQRQAVGSLWRVLGLWLEDCLRRPSWAVSLAAAFLIAGLALGLWRGHEANRDLDEVLARRYVQMVDPYQAGGGGLP